jgi:phage tail P2-like protein
MADLLPPPLASDARSQAMEAMSQRWDSFDWLPLCVFLVDLVAAEALPFLAEQFGVMGYDGWAFADSEAARRELVKSAIRIKRKKGTPWAIKRALGLAGFPNVEVWEHWQSVHLRKAGGGYLDGAKKLDGTKLLNGPPEPESRYLTGHWAEYTVYVSRETLSARQVADIRRICEVWAPARSKLVAVVQVGADGAEVIHRV